MKKVYPVHYKRSDVDESDTYFIVATNSQQAEEIAFSCIANNPPPASEGPDRPSSYGRKIAQVLVQESLAQPTECDKVGLIGSGSPTLIVRALALYVKEHIPIWINEYDELERDVGNIRYGSEELITKALALYVREHNQLH